MFSIAFKTLVIREVRRFLNVYNQTIIAPAINSILYFSIFSVLFSSKIANEGIDYKLFVASGLIIMSMLQNSYANTQATITTAKVLGFIIDFITPPLSTLNILFATVFAAIIRGFIVGLLHFTIFAFFVDFKVHNFFIMFFYMFFACALFALIGVIVGSISKTFDSSTSYNTYLIMPITFLSGTFFSILSLPKFWQNVIMFNPVFYIIDGFRFGLIGASDVITSTRGHFIPMLVLLVWVALLTLLTYFIMSKKYREY